MHAAALRKTQNPGINPMFLEQSGMVAAPRTSRNIPVMVSQAEYQRLRGARRTASVAHEPIDQKLAALLDSCY